MTQYCYITPVTERVVEFELTFEGVAALGILKVFRTLNNTSLKVSLVANALYGCPVFSQEYVATEWSDESAAQDFLTQELLRKIKKLSGGRLYCRKEGE